MLSHLLCLCFIWPALVLRYGLFAPRPPVLRGPRVAGRQWRTVRRVAGQLVAVRVQVVVVRGVPC